MATTLKRHPSMSWRRGMRFDRAYCQNPVCNPSRVSLLSGLRPDRTQVYTLLTHTRAHLGDWVMLPEYFRHNGYFTVQVGKIFHTDDGFEDPRSWDVEIREFGKRPPEDQIVKWGEPHGPGGHTIDWEWLKTADENTPDGMVARKRSATWNKPWRRKSLSFWASDFGVRTRRSPRRKSISSSIRSMTSSWPNRCHQIITRI